MRKSFRPGVSGFDALETKNLQSSLSLRAHHAPVIHRKPVAHVHHSTVQAPPHQYKKFWGTGDIFKGSLSGVAVDSGDAVLTSAQGTVTVLGVAHADAKIYINTTGKTATFSIQTDSGWIFGKAAYAPEWTGTTGWHYNTTGGTGDFSNINGTGYYDISGPSGGVTVSINPHQPQA